MDCGALAAQNMVARLKSHQNSIAEKMLVREDRGSIPCKKSYKLEERGSVYDQIYRIFDK